MMKNARSNAAANPKAGAFPSVSPPPSAYNVTAQGGSKPMPKFDYNSTAELFPARRRAPRRRQPLGYKRFTQAAAAIRFAMETLPPELLIGACLEVDEQRYSSEAIRRLYESSEYPLARRGVRS